MESITDIVDLFVDLGTMVVPVQPTDWAVPRISLATPARYFDIDLGLIILAEFKILSMVMLPLCLMFLTFFLSLGGSFKASIEYLYRKNELHLIFVILS